MLVGTWESIDVATAAGRRPRRLYALDPHGFDRATAALEEWRRSTSRNGVDGTPRPAPG